LAISLPEMRVLLVDDGEENRDLMSVVLAEAGATFATAENGLVAVEMATSQDWDVILMDMQMPVMDGYTATRKLREQGYKKPIVALTAHAMQQSEQECLDAGCSGFLTKPIDFDRLITTLAKIAGIEVTAAVLQPGCDDILTADETNKHDPANAGPIVSTLPMHKERFREIVSQFVGRLDERFDVMEKALEDEDAEQLVELGHWLKGASGNCGLAPIAETALKLEISGQEENLAAVPAILRELRELRARIEVPAQVPAPVGAEC
jgi:CheY-like chemotaxis protein/HPt (histidine-containing phosphotransfer) domain-containing protein